MSGGLAKERLVKEWLGAGGAGGAVGAGQRRGGGVRASVGASMGVRLTKERLVRVRLGTGGAERMGDGGTHINCALGARQCYLLYARARFSGVRAAKYSKWTNLARRQNLEFQQHQIYQVFYNREKNTACVAATEIVHMLYFAARTVKSRTTS